MGYYGQNTVMARIRAKQQREEEAKEQIMNKMITGDSCTKVAKCFCKAFGWVRFPKSPIGVNNGIKSRKG